MGTHMVSCKLLSVSAAAFALALAGCGSTTPEGFVATDFQAAPRQILKVETRGDAHMVYIDRRTGEVSPLERQRLDAFIADFASNRPESLRIEIRGPASTAQMQRVANLLIAAGIEAGKIRLHPGQPIAGAGAAGAPAGTEM